MNLLSLFHGLFGLAGWGKHRLNVPAFKDHRMSVHNHISSHALPLKLKVMTISQPEYFHDPSVSRDNEEHFTVCILPTVSKTSFMFQLHFFSCSAGELNAFICYSVTSYKPLAQRPLAPFSFSSTLGQPCSSIFTPLLGIKQCISCKNSV